VTTTLPEDFTTRPATLDDVQAAVELANLCSIELIGKPEWDVHQFRNDWQSPDLKPETDLWLVHTPDGKLVGYAGVWDWEPYVQMFGWDCGTWSWLAARYSETTGDSSRVPSKRSTRART